MFLKNPFYFSVGIDTMSYMGQMNEVFFINQFLSIKSMLTGKIIVRSLWYACFEYIHKQD